MDWNETIAAAGGPKPTDVFRAAGYEVLEELARGGQGIVYRARHVRLDKVVALKVLLDDDPNLLRRFEQEAQVLARLSHPNLLDVSDLGEVAGKPYLVMEFVTGEDLKSLVRRSGPRSPQEAAKILEAIAGALHYCHASGIVHRDVKPANIMIEEATGRPILADFGLVRRDVDAMSLELDREGRLSISGEVKGTPAFMAPEQAGEDALIGPRTDVYGLGSTLYFLLTGSPPYQGGSTYNILNALVTKPAPDPRELAPTVPRGLAALSQQAMAKLPEERPESAAAFAEALVRAVEPQGRGAVALLGAVLALVTLGVLLGVALLRLRGPDPATASAAPSAAQSPELGPSEALPSSTPSPASSPASSPQEEPSTANSGPGGPPKPPPLDRRRTRGVAGRWAARGQREPLWWTPTEAQRRYAEDRRLPLWFEDRDGQRFVLIPPGKTLAGESTGAFYLATTEVTNAQLRSFDPLHYLQNWENLVQHRAVDEAINALDRPAGRVSWNLAQAYCQRKGVRLPTGAEWEVAVRGETESERYWGDTLAEAHRFENLLDDAQGRWLRFFHPKLNVPGDDGHTLPSPGASFLPNPYGVYDALGNVFEWSADEHPQGRLLHGGAWFGNSRDQTRISHRPGRPPETADLQYGFRVARSTVPEGARELPRAPAPYSGGWSPSAAQRAYAEAAGLPVERVIDPGSLALGFVLIPPGEFVMGLHSRGGKGHRVKLSRGFYLQRAELSQAQLRTITGEGAPAVNRPAGYVSREAADRVCAWLSENRPGTYRLPTEAEWEYACRGGTSSRYPWGNESAEFSRYANISDPTSDFVHYAKDQERTSLVFDGFLCESPRGTFAPNAWGLYDMLGNVAEWVSDRAGPYPPGPVTDPRGPAQGPAILRGGHYAARRFQCVPQFRGRVDPGASPQAYWGLRLVLEP